MKKRDGKKKRSGQNLGGGGSVSRKTSRSQKSRTKSLSRPEVEVKRDRPFAADEVDCVVVPVDSTLYPLDAIYGAAYVFLDRAYVYLKKDGEKKVNVSLFSKVPATRESLLALGGEFVNELLSQAIRSTLDESSKRIREYIVVKSHYAQPTGTTNLEKLLDQTLKEVLEDDPLDIAVPWEEKYGKKDENKNDQR